MRISVAHVVNLVANGMTPQQIVVDLPDLDLVDVRQALGYAAALAKDELHPAARLSHRFLADAGVSPDTVAFLTRLGHDAIHVRTLDLHRAQDRELVDYARSEGRVIVTFDLDFGGILALGSGRVRLSYRSL